MITFYTLMRDVVLICIYRCFPLLANQSIKPEYTNTRTVATDEIKLIIISNWYVCSTCNTSTVHWIIKLIRLIFQSSHTFSLPHGVAIVLPRLRTYTKEKNSVRNIDTNKSRFKGLEHIPTTAAWERKDFRQKQSSEYQKFFLIPPPVSLWKVRSVHHISIICHSL